MNSRVIGLVVAGLSVVALSSTATGQPKPIWERNYPLPKGFNPGDTFPTMALASAVDGHPVSLAEFRGKKVIVNIFASW